MCRQKACAAVLLLLCGLHAAEATRVQWSTTGDFVNFPFSSPYPPYVVRTADGDAPDKIVAISDSNGAGSWTLSAFDAASGAVAWTSTVSAPDGSNAMLTAPCSGLPMSQQLENGLSMLFMQLGASILALDPSNGRQLWQHTAYNQSVPKITGHSGPIGSTVYLTSTFLDSSRFPPAPIHVIEALDAAAGALIWRNTTALPPASGLPTSDTATTGGVTPLPGLAVYAQGSRLFGISAADGKELWSLLVSAGTSTGTANVTSVVYVEPSPPQRPHPLLLLTSSTWEQTRHMAYKLNGSWGQPPVVAWQMTGSQNFEGSLGEGLVRLGLQEPQVSALDNVFVTWSNRTSYDLNNGGQPVYTTFLVGRSVDTGAAVWAKSMREVGFSQLPVSPPVVQLGTLTFVTGRQLAVWDAGSGSQWYVESSAPVEPQAAGGAYSYIPTSTFVNNVGKLAVVRCLGSDQPGSLCVYNGYEREAQTSAAQRQQQRPAAAAALAAAALAAAVAAAGWLT